MFKKWTNLYDLKRRPFDGKILLLNVGYIALVLGLPFFPIFPAYMLEISFGMAFVIVFQIILLSEYWKSFFPGILAYILWLLILYA